MFQEGRQIGSYTLIRRLGRGRARYLLTNYFAQPFTDYCAALKLDKFNREAQDELAKFPEVNCP